MASFTQMEIRFLKSCCYLYTKDGYKMPRGSKRISQERQLALINSAMNKLTDVLRNDPLTAQEATILLSAVVYVRGRYEIDTNAVDSSAVYNRLLEIAGGTPL